MASLYEIEVSLIGTKPKLWRRFLLSSTATFQDLHDAIQDACGWERCHLYSFKRPGLRGEEIASCDDYYDDFNDAAPKASSVTLKSFFTFNKKCNYVYDFGDGWDHEVKLKKVVESDEPLFRKLTAGEGVFPLEDCGGLGGYYHCIAVYDGNEEDQDILEWIEDWDPYHFDLKGTQQSFEIKN